MAVVTEVTQFGVYLIALDPTRGSEIKKTRPCLIVSPDEMNRHIRTVIVAPMTTTSRVYPTRVAVHFQGKEGQIVLDQIRTVDKSRLMKQLGAVSVETAQVISSVLVMLIRV
jgi:mRNA interferase MazF